MVLFFIFLPQGVARPGFQLLLRPGLASAARVTIELPGYRAYTRPAGKGAGPWVSLYMGSVLPHPFLYTSPKVHQGPAFKGVENVGT